MSPRNIYTGQANEPAPLFAYAEKQRALDSGPAMHRGVDTSVVAAESLDKDLLIGLRRKVYEYVLACGERGATCFEVESALAMKNTACRPRLTELSTRPPFLVYDSGQRRLTDSNRPAIVWRARAVENQS